MKSKTGVSRTLHGFLCSHVGEHPENPFVVLRGWEFG